jgi:hypothetical protein
MKRQVLERSRRAAPRDAQAAGDRSQVGEYLSGAVVGDDQPDTNSYQDRCHGQSRKASDRAISAARASVPRAAVT